jgi:DNA-binding MarR family transcriptional regulator
MSGSDGRGKKTDPEKLLDKLTDNMYLFFKMVNLLSFEIPGNLRLSFPELSTLARISRGGSVMVTGLAAETGVTKGAVSLLVSKLEKKGLVRKTVNPDCRTKIAISLTDAGQHVADSMDRLHREKNAGILAFLGALDRPGAEAVEAFLDEMENWLEVFRRTDGAYFLS